MPETYPTNICLVTLPSSLPCKLKIWNVLWKIFEEHPREIPKVYQLDGVG